MVALRDLSGGYAPLTGDERRGLRRLLDARVRELVPYCEVEPGPRMHLRHDEPGADVLTPKRKERPESVVPDFPKLRGHVRGGAYRRKTPNPFKAKRRVTAPDAATILAALGEVRHVS